MVPSTAPAVSYDYGAGFYSPYQSVNGPQHSLTASQTYDDYASDRVCAGAWENGQMYGGFACSNGFSQHCYSGQNLLYPRSHNGEGFAQQLHGRGFYGENCP